MASRITVRFRVIVGDTWRETTLQFSPTSTISDIRQAVNELDQIEAPDLNFCYLEGGQQSLTDTQTLTDINYNSNQFIIFSRNAPDPIQESIAALMELGYDETAVRAALDRTGFNREQAGELLLEGPEEIEPEVEHRPPRLLVVNDDYKDLAPYHLMLRSAILDRGDLLGLLIDLFGNSMPDQGEELAQDPRPLLRILGVPL
jgi:hypothetical protein